MQICGVIGCNYVVEGSLGDFPVCSLHDSPKTMAILERLEVPGAFWYKGRPVVVPCGPLEEKHLEPVFSRAARSMDEFPFDWIDESSRAHADFDLLAESA